MKRNSYVWLMMIILVIAAIACGGSSDSGDSGGDNNGSSDSGGDVKMVRDFPVLADAYEVVDSETVGIVAIVYKTKSSVADATAFYEEEMENAGHSLDTNVSANGVTAMTFDSNKVSIGIAPDPLDSSVTVVTIGKTP